MTTPIPIAVIAGQLVVGGAERQLYLWLANLDQRKYKPVVLTLNPGHGDHWETLYSTDDNVQSKISRDFQEGRFIGTSECVDVEEGTDRT